MLVNRHFARNKRLRLPSGYQYRNGELVPRAGKLAIETPNYQAEVGHGMEKIQERIRYLENIKWLFQTKKMSD